MSARTRKDWILWGALGCALVSTAHAEYTLATAAHFQKYVALAVPGALDLYVIRALQQRRDVFVAVLAMVAANVASHLIAGGVLAVTWHVIAAVGAVAPLIVWRVYSLKYTRTRQELLWGLDAGVSECGDCGEPVPDHARDCGRWRDPGAVSAPAPEDAVTMDNWAPGYHLDGCDGVHKHEGPFHCQVRASALGITAPDHVPADWSKTSAVPYLAPVPDLPDEYAPGAVHSESPLTASDWDYLAGAQKYVDDVADPSVRGLKRELRIGQDRAERLLTHLGVIL